VPHAPIIRKPSALRPIEPLGLLLCRQGLLAAADLDLALERQSRHAARIGEILVANGAIDQAGLETALRLQAGQAPIDLVTNLPDPALLAQIDPIICLREGWMPWRRIGGQVVLVTESDIAPSSVPKDWSIGPGYRVERARLGSLRPAINAAYGPQLLARAQTLCPEHHACRSIAPALRALAGGLVLAFGAGLILAPITVFALVLSWFTAMNTATSLLRLGALFGHFKNKQATAPPEVAKLAERRRQPRVSILIPLLHEDEVISALLERINLITYPHELLDVLILTEADDMITANALARHTLPPWINVLSLPADRLRTKPKAMNYALPFCQGSIIGIYDAEDRPEPDQIAKIVAHLQSSSQKVACVQGFLDFYNTRTNWLSRCFSIEYAMWFRVLLRGIQHLGLPIPLGGTTVFFRRNVLEEIGGWDAHNVTEDADLGFRLARYGYRCEIVETTTWEEANCVPLGWIKQRSRWLKGYAMTWASHMRKPSSLLRDMGLRNFLGFQIMVLGGLSAYLSMPLVWGMWLGWLAGLASPLTILPQPVIYLFFGSAMLGQSIMLAVAFLALRARERRGLLPFVLTLPLYWPLGALAAYRAVAELIVAPFYWAKTYHGLDSVNPKAD